MHKQYATLNADAVIDRDSFQQAFGYVQDRKNKRKERRARKGHEFD